MSGNPKTCECELFVVVDGCGDYAVGKTAEDAREAYENEVQALADAEGFRTVRLLVTVPPPEVVELAGTAPAQGAAALRVVE
jgi:hypothetical protein